MNPHPKLPPRGAPAAVDSKGPRMAPRRVRAVSVLAALMMAAPVVSFMVPGVLAHHCGDVGDWAQGSIDPSCVSTHSDCGTGADAGSTVADGIDIAKDLDATLQGSAFDYQCNPEAYMNPNALPGEHYDVDTYFVDLPAVGNFRLDVMIGPDHPSIGGDSDQPFVVGPDSIVSWKVWKPGRQSPAWSMASNWGEHSKELAPYGAGGGRWVIQFEWEPWAGASMMHTYRFGIQGNHYNDPPYISHIHAPTILFVDEGASWTAHYRDAEGNPGNAVFVYSIIGHPSGGLYPMCTTPEGGSGEHLSCQFAFDEPGDYCVMAYPGPSYNIGGWSGCHDVTVNEGAPLNQAPLKPAAPSGPSTVE